MTIKGKLTLPGDPHSAFMGGNGTESLKPYLKGEVSRGSVSSLVTEGVKTKCASTSGTPLCTLKKVFFKTA